MRAEKEVDVGRELKGAAVVGRGDTLSACPRFFVVVVVSRDRVGFCQSSTGNVRDRVSQHHISGSLALSQLSRCILSSSSFSVRFEANLIACAAADGNELRGHGQQ